MGQYSIRVSLKNDTSKINTQEACVVLLKVPVLSTNRFPNTISLIFKKKKLTKLGQLYRTFLFVFLSNKLRLFGTKNTFYKNKVCI